VRLVKNDPRFRIVTYGELARELEPRERVITKEDLLHIRPQLCEYFSP